MHISCLRRGYLETASPSLNLMLVLLTAYTVFGVRKNHSKSWILRCQITRLFPFSAAFFPVKNKRGENTVCHQIWSGNLCAIEVGLATVQGHSWCFAAIKNIKNMLETSKNFFHHENHWWLRIRTGAQTSCGIPTVWLGTTLSSLL